MKVKKQDPQSNLVVPGSLLLWQLHEKLRVQWSRPGICEAPVIVAVIDLKLIKFNQVAILP